MIKTKLLLNYPTKFQSIRKSFSIFDIYDKINDILKRKHILSKKLKNMYGGGDTKQVYDLQQILQSIEEMNGELGTLEANLIVGFKNFPSFDTNVNTMNEFLKGVIDNIKNEQENHKDKYESINSIINDQFNTKVTIDGVEYETKNNILEEASKALSQQIKNKNFKDAYGIIKSVYEEYKNKKNTKIQVFIGCKNEDTLVFKKQLPAIKQKHELNLIMEDEKLSGLSNGQGFITDLIKKKKIYKKAKVFVCGPDVMYKFVVKELLAKGIDPKNIYLSLEKRMHCGVGVCQHCAIGPKYVCKDGPVFPYSFLKKYYKF